MTEHRTLGDLIDALEKADPNAEVAFMFGGWPTGLDSYRGHYDQLAIEWDLETPMMARTLLAHAREALTIEFTGYKGGQYHMGRETPLWCSRYGDASGCAVTGIDVSKPFTSGGGHTHPGFVRIDIEYAR